jgi:hypothetical protein
MRKIPPSKRLRNVCIVKSFFRSDEKHVSREKSSVQIADFFPTYSRRNISPVNTITGRLCPLIGRKVG